ncbi:hypothetical protein AMTR_s00006p00141840 [Amborella trichopoda]|uniref:Uncharacterized protein n=1 Tax=Amborella trichopoda TaxID=13333 RepID=W1PDG5_AMBTC|nr:hypothetical protein AMTR_s00006p00141840 [Amborella trichopoda]
MNCCRGSIVRTGLLRFKVLRSGSGFRGLVQGSEVCEGSEFSGCRGLRGLKVMVHRSLRGCRRLRGFRRLRLEDKRRGERLGPSEVEGGSEEAQRIRE